MKVKRGGKYAASMIALALGACSSSPTGSSVVRGNVAKPAPTTTTAAPAPGTAGAPGAAAPGAAGDFVIKPSVPTIQSGSAGAGLKDGQCASQNIPFTRVTPTVWLVLDGSGSMVDMLGDKSRFVALKEALMDPTAGVVKQLEHDVHWGMVMYDGPLPGGGANQTILPDGAVVMFTSPPATSCPRVVSVEPKADNFEDINKAYPPDPLGGSTPTDKALEAVIAHLPDSGNAQVLDGKSNPTIVVLATDGAPNDFCSESFLPPDVRPNVISAVNKLAASEIKTYVISLAGDDQNLTAHLTDVAAAGKTGKPPFIPTSKDQLVQVFRDIVGPAAACDIVLNGKVKVGSECRGKILINGKELPCNDPNGWKLSNESTVSIQGTACEQYKADRQSFLQADFPCDLIILN